MALSNKHQDFIDEYFLSGMNATRAAIRAGYSKKTARSQGQRLLTNVDISAEIDRRLAKKKLSANMVLSRLSDMAMSNIADFADINDTSDLKRYRHKTHVIKKFKKTITTTKKGETFTSIELELYGADSALVNLGRHYKLFTDSVKVDDWRTEIIELFKQGKITKEDVLNEFADEPGLAEGLFESIGIRAIEVREAQAQSAESG